MSTAAGVVVVVDVMSSRCGYPVVDRSGPPTTTTTSTSTIGWPNFGGRNQYQDTGEMERLSGAGEGRAALERRVRVITCAAETRTSETQQITIAVPQRVPAG